MVNFMCRRKNLKIKYCQNLQASRRRENLIIIIIIIKNNKSVGGGKLKFNYLVNCHKSDGGGKITIISCLIAASLLIAAPPTLRKLYIFEKQ